MTRKSGRPRYLRIMDELTSPDIPRILNEKEYWIDWVIDEEDEDYDY
jgi:hypothetical protein